MVFEFVLGFLILVAASYLGTTMALRGFFGREYFEPPDDGAGRPPGSGSPPDERARHGDRPEDRRTRTDDVPRASDVVNDEDG